MTEGDFNHVPHPFQIPYGVMLSEKFDNLLVSVAISSRRVGFCGIRLEPTWAALGQAAGLAASLSLKNGGDVTKVSVPALQALLVKKRAKLIYVSDVEADSPYFEALQYFGTQGFFHDLYPLEQVNLTSLPILKLQYRAAAQYHHLEPEKPLDAHLAQQWYRKLPATQQAKAQHLADSKAWTRGEFLQALYTRP